MSSTIGLGRIRGVEIGIHWSWALIFALLVWSLSDVVFPDMNPGLDDTTYFAMAVVAVVLFFTSLIAHELGHATRALREGMAIEGITLWIFGGIARFKGQFPSAGAEFRIAIAGPIVSLLIGGAALLFALLVPLPAAVDGVIFWVGYVNLVLLVFNMLPALPLDGGRVLRSALWARRHDFVAATHTAAAIGRGFGQFLIALGVIAFLFGGSVGGIWFVFIGWFLLAAAEAERIAADTHVALTGVVVGDVMVEQPITVDSAMDLERFMDERFFTSRHATYPVLERGRPVGLITFRSVLALPRATWADRRVADVMVPLDQLPVFRRELPLESAIEKLASSAINRGLVIGDDHLDGLLSITDATRVIEARSRGLGLRPDAGPAPAGA